MNDKLIGEYPIFQLIDVIIYFAFTSLCSLSSVCPFLIILIEIFTYFF